MNTQLSLSIDKYKILNVFLGILIFFLIIDPTNQIFRLKELLFVLFVGSYFVFFPKNTVNLLGLGIVVIIFIIYFASLIVASVIGSELSDETSGIFKSFLFLTLLLFTRDPNLNFFNKLLIPSLIVAIIMISIYIIIAFMSPALELLVYQFSMAKGMVIMMSRREFVGISIISVYYKTSPVLLIPLSICWWKFLKEGSHKKRYFLYSVVFMIALFISGTRANILAMAGIVVLLLIKRMQNYNWGKLLLLPVILLVAFSSFIVLAKILGDKQEQSLSVKTGHLYTFIDLYNTDSILLFGQGPGAYYYSQGSKDFISYSELSYLEQIRMYGILGGSFIIGIFLLPIIITVIRKPLYYIEFILGYSAYLFVGGTNPFLINSTGFLVLAVAYSYPYVYYKTNYYLE